MRARVPQRSYNKSLLNVFIFLYMPNFRVQILLSLFVGKEPSHFLGAPQIMSHAHSLNKIIHT